MDVDDFWRFLERSAEEETHPQRRADWLTYRLSRIALDHVLDFQIHLGAVRRPIDTWDMLGAANLIMDGHFSDDSFWYFQPWEASPPRGAYGADRGITGRVTRLPACYP